MTLPTSADIGIDSIVIEMDEHYFGAVKATTPKLAKLLPGFKGERLTVDVKSARMSALVDGLGNMEAF